MWKKMRKSIFFAATVTVLSGCGSARPPIGPDNLACGIDNYTVKDSYDKLHVYFLPKKFSQISINADMATPLSQDKSEKFPSELNVLELSAGGEYGAYGSGFLVGWGSTGSEAKPVARSDIQIVTGVSTGSIMATYAFLGDRDEKLVEFYSTLDDTKIYTKNGYLTLIHANSLYDTQGKRDLLKFYLNTEVINQVALMAQTAPNRTLYIGLVDLDSGEFKRVDMVALANGIADRQLRDNCYRAVIDASSAIEVAFQPVFIDDKMLGDGGVRRHLFLVSAEPSKANGKDEMVDLHGHTLRTFAFVHGDLDVGTQKTNDGVLPIAERTMSIFTDQTMKDSIRLNNALALHPEVVVGDKAALKLPRFTPFYAAAQSSACKCKEETKDVCGPTSQHGADIFCRPYMICLAKYGKADGIRYAKTGNWLSFEEMNLGSNSGCKATSDTPQIHELLK